MKRQPTGKRIELSPRDIEIFELLTRYRYLRSTYIHAFVGGASETRFKERLGDLYHEGGYLDRPRRQWDCVNARYMPLVYENTPKAMEALHASGRGVETFRAKRGDRQFAHTLMTCETLASIELAVRDCPELRFIPWSEIAGKAPQSVGKGLHPFALHVPAGSGKKKQGQLVPDGLFGLEYTVGDRPSYRFFALEVDRGTMPVRRSGHGQSVFTDKLEAYRCCLAAAAHTIQWGVPNLLVLTVTTSVRRMENMKSLLQKAPAGSKVFLFKSADMSLVSGGQARPEREMLIAPWERAGHPSVSIAEP